MDYRTVEFNPLDFTGERVVPWAPNMRAWTWVLQHHLARYTWALDLCQDREVVDLGCGTGYGSSILSYVANKVTGLDISVEAISFAARHFSRPNLFFETRDLEADSFPWAQVYICFEVLEHLRQPATLLKRLPVPSILIWSMPVNDPGRFHIRPYSVAEIKEMMKGSSFYHQIGCNIYDDASADAKYILGVMDIVGGSR